MSKPIISVENLSKAYRLGSKEETPDTLIGAMTAAVKAPMKNFNRLRRLDTFGSDTTEDDTLWALKDVSFDVQEGEVVGIIGRNGAGKSTLLKILSRITEPTSGRAIIRGRVSSLLEVGTGFHPELTGRDNVYMNGTILGMTKREIDQKFDEIVDFSGVEKFLDTPVKRYSSGMKVRLAFAVAAHLEPEVLIIDEVLAVGDAEFQRKCLGKMQDVASHGRTVLFVSHNMAAVENLCERAVFLKAGTIAFEGPTFPAVQKYLSTSAIAPTSSDLLRHSRSNGMVPIISELLIGTDTTSDTRTVGVGKSIKFSIGYTSTYPLDDASFSIIFSTPLGVNVLCLQTRQQFGPIQSVPNTGTVTCHVPNLPLSPGKYLLSVGCGSRKTQIDRVENVAQLSIESRDALGTGFVNDNRHGFFILDAEWNIP